MIDLPLAQPRYDPDSIRTLFDEMASTYGHVNLISSFGFTARWRNQTVNGLPLKSAGCVIDLMSGMGELWRSLATVLPASARVIGVDISPEMARRASREWHFPVEVCVADVLTWDPQPSPTWSSRHSVSKHSIATSNGGLRTQSLNC